MRTGAFMRLPSSLGPGLSGSFDGGANTSLTKKASLHPSDAVQAARCLLGLVFTFSSFNFLAASSFSVAAFSFAAFSAFRGLLLGILSRFVLASLQSANFS